MGYYKYVGDLYRGLRKKLKKPENSDFRSLIIERKKQWRKGDSIVRSEKPQRIDRARSYGYKAKQGFVIVRARVRKGGMRKSRPIGGRKPKRMGVRKITPSKSIQRIAEERAQRKFINLEVLGSYWLWEDGLYKWFEVFMKGKSHS